MFVQFFFEKLLNCKKLKQWRQTNNKKEGEDSPIPTKDFTELWTVLIEKVLPIYLVNNIQNQILIEPALEAVSHIEPEVFQERLTRAFLKFFLPKNLNLKTE